MIELSLLLKATMLLTLGLAASALARHARAAVRHLWLAATLGSLAVLPVLAWSAPAVTIAVPARYASLGLPPAAPPAPSRADANARRPAADRPLTSSTRGQWTAPSWRSAIRLLWLLGALVTMASVGRSLASVRRIRREGLPRPELRALTQELAAGAGVRRPILVIEHEDVPAPLTCGLRYPAIVLPCDARDWPDADLRRALIHEIEHVARADWAVQLAARAVCACYWFHPLTWTVWRGLRLEAERACDDAVLRSADRTDYADQLIVLAGRFAAGHSRAMLGMANRSDLSTRVTALLDDRLRRGHASTLSAAGALLAAGLVVAVLAPVRAAAAAPAGNAAGAAQRIGGAAEREQETTKAKVILTEVEKDKDNDKQKVSRRAGPLERALYEAAADGDLASIDKLLQVGANVNAAIDGDGSPLIAAARSGGIATVRHLLDRGADPNMPVPGDGAPLLAAAQEGETAVVGLLLDRRANIELIVPGDENALIQASANGRLEVVKLLVARGANVNAQVWVDEGRPTHQGEWRTPLLLARRGRHADVVAFLLASGARE
jgi:beta-lactamase regulating signal transducer with metallopeptidase domain